MTKNTTSQRDQAQAVLFDFDGTLIDASQAICSSFRSALGAARAALADDDTIRGMIGRPLREMFCALHADATDSELDAYVVRYREAFLPVSATLSRPLPGVTDCVRALSSTHRLAIVTTRLSDGAIRMLRAHGLLAYFDAIVGLEHVKAPKPDPEPVNEALRRLGVIAANAWMVGDTPDDIVAGRRAGARTVGVTTGCNSAASLWEAGADAVLKDLSELCGVLDGPAR